MDNIKNPTKKPKLKKSYSNSTIFQKLMVDDVRNKILFTILCLLIYRLGCGITIPFVNTAALQTMFGSTSVLDYYNLVSGGALSQCAVFAIGVSAYINASIIIQLLTVAIPKLEEISKDIGGQKQINKITQYVGCGLAAVTAIGYFFIMKNYGAMKYTSGISQVVEAITVIAILTAGSQIVIWLGWLIDEKGIGNGISLIIFTGIISRWDAVISLFQNSIAMGKENGWWYYLMIPGVILFVLAATFYVVFASDAERRVPVQYAGKNVGNKASTGQSSYIPIKLIKIAMGVRSDGNLSRNLFEHGEKAFHYSNTVKSYKDCLSLLENNLPYAGVSHESKHAMASVLYSAYVNKLPLLLMGPSSKEIADTLSLSVTGNYANQLQCDGPCDIRIIRESYKSTGVLVVTNAFGSDWMISLLQELNQAKCLIVFVHPFIEDISIEASSLYSYCCPISTVDTVDNLADMNGVTGACLSDSFEAYVPTVKGSKRADELMAMSASKLFVRNLAYIEGNAASISGNEADIESFVTENIIEPYKALTQN